MSLSRLCRGRGEDDGCAGREDPRGSTPGKRPRRCSCFCCQRVQSSTCSLFPPETKDFYEGQIDILKKEMQCLSKCCIEERITFQREMQEFYRNSQLQLKEQISEHCRRMEVSYHDSHLLIWEQFNTLISEIRASRDHVWRYSNLRVLSHQNKTKTYRLKFENKCCDDKYSGHVIVADDGNPVKVAIYDNDNRIISDGPLSSMQVKIVVLDGAFNKENKEQWSGDSFLKNIVYARPGKPPLLSHELYTKLENGVANLCGIKFQDNVPSKKLRLGVMAADDSISEKILEGVSESFAIKAGRGFSKKKDPHPSLTDPVYKLKKIWENGDRHKLLEQMQIKLVKDFLWFYNKDKDGLRKDCGNISAHDWDIIVEHALSCRPGRDHYSYSIPEMDATVFFNSLYIIVGAVFNGKYSSYEELNDTQKVLVDASKTSAYDHLKVVRHDGKNSFHEHGVLARDKGRSYLRESCSIQQLPTLPMKFHDIPSRAPFCRDCDEPIHVPGTLSGNHQRYLATGIRVDFGAASGCSGADSAHDADHHAPPKAAVEQAPSSQTTSATTASAAAQQVPSPPQFLPQGWAVDELLQFSDYESGGTMQESPLGFKELDWFADIDLFQDQAPKAGRMAAEVPELFGSQADEDAAYYRPSKPGKKARIEVPDDEDDNLLVPDLG